MASIDMGERKDGEVCANVRKGCLVGRMPEEDEAIICAATGIVRAVTVKKQSIEEPWNAEQLLAKTPTAWTVGRKSDRHKL